MPRRAPAPRIWRRPAIRAQVPSPFDYPNRTRVLVVRDVRKDDLVQVAAAYRALFEASHGGGLGLFTAISRLRAVHRRIAGPLEAAGLPLLAQHVDGLDVSTLVEVFQGGRAGLPPGHRRGPRRRRRCPAARCG